MPLAEVLELVTDTLALLGHTPAAVTALATVDVKAAEPGLAGVARQLGVPLLSYAAEALAAVRVPAPSRFARDVMGTPSVAEAAALLAAGPGAELVVGKRKSAPHGRPPGATCAIAAAAGREGAGTTGPEGTATGGAEGPATTAGTGTGGAAPSTGGV
ncbi:cobalamin biosynthesis protein [Streptomyces halobius]|uniref:cobalamin biosynthesis protein n=1 Tax=Streptomyces halobius TaxID=2879846 RepID=UPI00200D8286